MSSHSQSISEGLSPRVRGNLLQQAAGGGGRRSIPACAGEPLLCLRPTRPGRVYPRVCGGTLSLYIGIRNDYGLSPRVRGNPLSAPVNTCQHRSIPACAGEPQARPRSVLSREVYPRVCGGTAIYDCRPGLGQGLSPRVRGNPLSAPVNTCQHRSIPACAGEPGLSCTSTAASAVYPRVCGGTAKEPGITIKILGLSPRVRGNLARTASMATRIGSIPACAGEPDTENGFILQWKVYPRVCGGTFCVLNQGGLVQGLSPRVRGNPLRCGSRSLWPGSIPACAGEPDLFRGCYRCLSVYPRVCGGTVGSYIAES